MSETSNSGSTSGGHTPEDEATPPRTEVKRRTRDGEVYDPNVHKIPDDLNEKTDEDDNSEGNSEGNSTKNEDGNNDGEDDNKNGGTGDDTNKEEDDKKKKNWFPFNRNKKQKSFTVEVYQLPFRDDADSTKVKDDVKATEETTEKTEEETEEEKLPPVPQGSKLVATVKFEAKDEMGVRSKTKLSDVRTKMKKDAPTVKDFKFCTEHGIIANVKDTQSLQAYFGRLAAYPPLKSEKFHVFIVTPGINASGESVEEPESIISQSLFLLTFIRITNYSKQNSGSIHSSVFKGKDPGSLLLQDIRKLIKKMSGDPEKDEFCLEDGTAIDDGVTLTEYLSMTGHDDMPKSKEKKKKPGKSPKASVPKAESPAPSTETDPSAVAPAETKKEEAKDLVVREPGNSVAEGGTKDVKDNVAAVQEKSGEQENDEPDADEPATELKNTTRVVKIWFHKTGSEVKKTHEASKEVKEMLEKLKPNLTLREQKKLELNLKALQVKEELKASDYAPTAIQAGKHASQLNETEWETVLQNSGVFYGWRIDIENNRIVRATKPAFRLRSGLNMPKPIQKERERKTSAVTEEASSEPAGKTTDNTASKEVAASNTASGAQPTEKSGADKTKPEKDTAGKGTKPSAPSKTNKLDKNAAEDVDVEELLSTAPNKPNAIPYFIVTDKSSVNVVSVTHEFQESMASNRFDSTSVEASVSGGAFGWSAAVSGGAKSENESANSSSSKKYGKVLLATYKFPRVTVYLNPDDLEPTDDLKEALQVIRKQKNIKHLRKLHETYGHLFCHQVELGGCLETSKVVKADATTSESSEKHQFKAEVGVAVSSPYGIGGSMKASHEKGNQEASGTSTQNQSEAMSFDATGGNTLLAANPPAWTASVMDFNNWRVIERSRLTPLADAIAGNPKYSGVKQWFLQAVPKLSEYLTVPDSRTIDVRFKVILDDSLTRVLGKTIPAYLAHYPDNPPKPIQTSLRKTTRTVQKSVVKYRSELFGLLSIPYNDMTTFTEQVDVEDKDAMFFPASTQAPVIASPKVDEKIGTRSDTERSRVVWTIEVPTGNSIGHNSRVSIVCRTKVGTGEQTHEVALSMGVYRNQQGVFLPAMYSSDEHSLWRILKYDDSKDGDQIKDGERVRLCWKFSDQTGGFRDFHEDSYGRRRFTKPRDMTTDALYLKLPYPGFQNLKSDYGSSMVLSPEDKKVPVTQKIDLLKRDTDGKTIVQSQNSYSLFDLSFRLDTVGNNGEGDALDFMNSASRAAHTSTEKSQVPEPGSPQDILTALIYGANMRLASPALSLMLL